MWGPSNAPGFFHQPLPSPVSSESSRCAWARSFHHTAAQGLLDAGDCFGPRCPSCVVTLTRPRTTPALPTLLFPRLLPAPALLVSQADSARCVRTWDVDLAGFQITNHHHLSPTCLLRRETSLQARRLIICTEKTASRVRTSSARL